MFAICNLLFFLLAILSTSVAGVKFSKIQWKILTKSTESSTSKQLESIDSYIPAAWGDHKFDVFQYFVFTRPDGLTSYVAIMGAAKSPKVFFIAFTYEAGGLIIHMISSIEEDPELTKEYATAYLTFFGTEFVEGNFDSSKQQQVFDLGHAASERKVILSTTMPEIVIKLPDAYKSKPKETIAITPDTFGRAKFLYVNFSDSSVPLTVDLA